MTMPFGSVRRLKGTRFENHLRTEESSTAKTQSESAATIWVSKAIKNVSCTACLNRAMQSNCCERLQEMDMHRIGSRNSIWQRPKLHKVKVLQQVWFPMLSKVSPHEWHMMLPSVATWTASAAAVACCCCFLLCFEKQRID